MLVACVVIDARAQSQLEVPGPAQQNNPPVAPAKPYTSRSQPGGTLVLPQEAPPPTVQQPSGAPPVPDTEPPEPEAQIRPPAAPAPPPLPEIFRGCWEGVVQQLDSIERLPGAPPLGMWVAKTYRLCYRRVGDGPFQLTFADAGMMRSRMVTNSQGMLKVLSTDGRSFAQMRALLQFQEFAPPARGGGVFGVDEVTDLSAQIRQGTMYVQAQVYGEHGGRPWFRASWHATFVHTPG